MTTSRIDEFSDARVVRVRCDDRELTVDLADGRRLSLPVVWYPRLQHARQEERDRWEILGDGYGIHWPDLDEDLSTAGLLAGRASGESARSLKRWLTARQDA